MFNDKIWLTDFNGTVKTGLTLAIQSLLLREFLSENKISASKLCEQLDSLSSEDTRARKQTGWREGYKGAKIPLYDSPPRINHLKNFLKGLVLRGFDSGTWGAIAELTGMKAKHGDIEINKTSPNQIYLQNQEMINEAIQRRFLVEGKRNMKGKYYLSESAKKLNMVSLALKYVKDAQQSRDDCERARAINSQKSYDEDD